MCVKIVILNAVEMRESVPCLDSLSSVVLRRITNEERNRHGTRKDYRRGEWGFARPRSRARCSAWEMILEGRSITNANNNITIIIGCVEFICLLRL